MWEAQRPGHHVPKLDSCPHIDHGNSTYPTWATPCSTHLYRVFLYKENVLSSWRSGISVLFCYWVVSNSLWPHGLQHARLSCPSPSPGVCSKSCPYSRWRRTTISCLSSPSPPALNLSQHQDLFQPCVSPWNYQPCCVGPPEVDGSQWTVLTETRVVHWQMGWQTTSVFLAWEPQERNEKSKRNWGERDKAPSRAPSPAGAEPACRVDPHARLPVSARPCCDL